MAEITGSFAPHGQEFARLGLYVQKDGSVALPTVAGDASTWPVLSPSKTNPDVVNLTLSDDGVPVAEIARGSKVTFIGDRHTFDVEIV